MSINLDQLNSITEALFNIANIYPEKTIYSWICQFCYQGLFFWFYHFRNHLRGSSICFHSNKFWYLHWTIAKWSVGILFPIIQRTFFCFKNCHFERNCISSVFYILAAWKNEKDLARTSHLFAFVDACRIYALGFSAWNHFICVAFCRNLSHKRATGIDSGQIWFADCYLY